MTTIRQLLERKDRDAITIGLDDAVYRALVRMAELDVGDLLRAVTDQQQFTIEQPVGYVSGSSWSTSDRSLREPSCSVPAFDALNPW